MPLPRQPEPDAIDRWLHVSLLERYAETLREPVPDALLKLLSDCKR